jgi:uncharacterized protein YkwD
LIRPLTWLLVIALAVYSSWIGWELWQYHAQNGSLSAQSAVDVLIARTKAIPDEVAGFFSRATDEPAIRAAKEPANESDSPASSSQQTPAPPAKSGEALNIANIENLIHNLVNQQRQAQELRPLGYDGKLVEIARGHSLDMALYDCFSHINLAGEDPSVRAERQGYACHKDYGTYYVEGIAENVFQDWLYSSITRVYGI